MIARSLGSLALLVVMACAAATSSCAAAKPIVQTALDIGVAACSVIDVDTTNPNVQLVCKYIDQADGVAKVVLAIMPREKARALAAQINASAPAPAAVTQ